MAASMAQRPVLQRAPFKASRVAGPVRAPLSVCNSYKNLENIDLSKVADYAKHGSDTGSPEYQVARLTARVRQISTHLATNKKDHAARRGLMAILSERKSLLQYLYRKDRDAYDKLCADFSIRGVVVSDTRGAARKSDDLEAAAA